MNQPGKEAAEFAARGWPVLPLHHPLTAGCSCGSPSCGSVAKHPRIRGGLNNATTDQRQISEWWNRWPRANIGIRTGAASGLVVVDIDPAHGGLDSLQRLQRRNGALPDTLRVITGSQGAHLYFQHPGGQVRNDAGRRLGAGLDVRGDGGYIVAPPSVHAVGRRYGWERAAEVVAPLPDWLHQRLIDRTPTLRYEPAAAVAVGDYAHRALDRAATAVTHAPVGTRNNTLNRAAFRMGRLVDAGAVPRAMVENALENAGVASGLSLTETRATVASGINASTRRVSRSAGREPDALRDLEPRLARGL